jgi:hypothetical protein
MKATAILMIAALLLPCMAHADISPHMSYQGVLRDAGGSPVPDGTYRVDFRIYDVATGGSSLWMESHDLTSSDGIINATLGTTTPLTGLDFDVPYWLGVAIQHEAELTPRTEMTSVPYAAHAGYADTAARADTADYVLNGAGDSDWTINGDDVYHVDGKVGIGTTTPAAKLHVDSENQDCARFMNYASRDSFTITAINGSGTAGGFFSETSAGAYPGTPAAIFAKAGLSNRGGHFTADDGDGLFAYSATSNAVRGLGGTGYSGYFTGGQGLYTDNLDTDAFEMSAGASDGYVLTSDESGVGTWQAPAAVPDGDWEIYSDNLWSEVSGGVSINCSTLSSKLGVHNYSFGEALEVREYDQTAGRMIDFERMIDAASGSDMLQLKATAASPDGIQFIECERGSTIEFAIDGNGHIASNSGADFDGAVTVDGEFDVTGTSLYQAEVRSSSNTDATKVLSGISTASGAGYHPIGVYGESIPAEGYGTGGLFWGGRKGVFGYSGATGAGTYQGVYGGAENALSSYEGNYYGVYGIAAGGQYNYGVYGYAHTGSFNYAGYFAGDVNITGTLYGGVPACRIDHPLDPENRYLQHSCVESDDMMNIYNGNVVLDGRGEAWVEMPDWFEALNQDFRYQLTAVGAPGPNLYIAEKISGNRFMISGGVPGSEVSWQVTGVRHDPLAATTGFAVEVDKPAAEAGKYMHPEAYGMPASMGIDRREDSGVDMQRATHVEPSPRSLQSRDETGGTQ